MAFRLPAMPFRLSKRQTICMGPEAADVIIKVDSYWYITVVQQCRRHLLTCLPFCSKTSMSMHFWVIIFSAAGMSKCAVCRQCVTAQVSQPGA